MILVPAKCKSFKKSHWTGIFDAMSPFYWRGSCWLCWVVHV
jgi:hypothetical protein